MSFPNPMPSENEIKSRIKNLQKHLNEKKIDGAIIVQNSDLYYFTRTIQQSNLYVPSNSNPILMTRKSFDRAKSETCIKNLVNINSIKEIPNVFKETNISTPKTIGMELDVLPVNHYLAYKKIFTSSTIVDISTTIREIRAIKSDYEISMIRKAAKFSDKIFETVPTLIKVGMTEVELAGKIECLARQMGHQGIIRMRMWGNELFYGHIMSGKTAAIPTYLASPTGGESVSIATSQGAGFKKIKKNEPILIDFVFALNGYLSDQTRIYSIGNLSNKIISKHKHMLDIHEELKLISKPNVQAEYLYNFVIEKINKLKLLKNFMGFGKDKANFVGHGVGLELDEFPFIAPKQKTLLKNGMTLALEPKLVFPGQGTVGIENTFVMTETGLEQLTNQPNDIVFI